MKKFIISIFVVLAAVIGAVGMTERNIDKSNSPMSLCEVLRMCDPELERR